MAEFWPTVFVTVLCFQFIGAFILSLKKSDGSLDTEHLVGHVTLLEQMVTQLQQTVTSQGADIIAMKSEIASLQTIQQKLDRRIYDLQKQNQSGLVTAEMTSLKDEVNAATAELRLVSNQVISLTSKCNNLTRDYRSLSSQVNSTGAARDVELKELDQKYQSLSSVLNSTDADKNISETVHVLQETLGRVIPRVHSAENDRFLLHSYVTRLNKTVSELNTRSNELSSKIAQLNTEVGFEIWWGPVNVKLPSGSVLKFSNIQYNIGGGYNASTGAFTVSVSGTYLFWSQVRGGNAHGGFAFVINKSGTSIVYSNSPTSSDVTGSNIVSARVTAGESVCVLTFNLELVNHSYFSRFGGTLLQRY